MEDVTHKAICVKSPFPSELFEILSSHMTKCGYELVDAWQSVPVNAIAQIIDSAKNRLLEFVLELNSEAERSGGRIEDVKPNHITDMFPQFFIE